MHLYARGKYILFGRKYMTNSNKPTKISDAPEGGVIVLIGDSPFPIAFYLKKVFDSEGNFHKLNAIFETLENTLAYIDLILLSFYYQEGVTSANIEPIAKRLETANLDDWFQFLEISLAQLKVNHPIIQQLQQWQKTVEGKKEIYIQHIVDYKKAEFESGILSNLIEIQKNIIPVMHIMLESEINAYYNFCFSSLIKIIKELKFLQDYGLYFVESTNTLRTLMGDNRNFPKINRDIPQQYVNQVILFAQKTNQIQTLHPFIIYQECYYCIKEEMKDTHEVFLWHGRTTSRAIYHGCVHNVALREHLANYHALQERTRLVANTQNPNIPTKEIWERTFQATEETLTHLRKTKIIRKYLSRRYPEFILESFRNNPTYPIFILSGSRGSGKTTLLSEMAKRWMTHGEVVLFQLVFGQNGIDLEKDIAIQLGVANWSQLPHSSSVSWIIILDSVENTSDPEKFFQGIAKFAKKYSQEVRIILSISEFHIRLWQQYIEKCVPELGENVNLQSLVMPWRSASLLNEGTFYFSLPWFDLSQIKELYRTMCLDMPSPLTPLSNFSESIQNILCNPSMMSIFLMCLKNREVPKVLSFNDMLEGYVLNQISGNKNRREFLEALLELLLQNQNNTIALDSLVESGNVLLSKESLACTCLSTLAELTRDGVIGRLLISCNQDKKAFIYFPNNIVREYFVYRSLALMGKHKDELLIEDIKKIGQGNETLYGVVFFALMRLANKQYFDRINQIIQQTQDFPILSRYLLYQILLLYKIHQTGKFGDGGTMDIFVSSLITMSNSVGILALTDFAMHIYHQGQFENAAYVLEKITQNVVDIYGEYDPLILTTLAAYSWYKAGQLQNAVRLYKKVVKNIKKIEGRPQEYELYLFLAKGHREIGDRERSEFFFKKVYDQRDNIRQPFLEAALYEEAGYLAQEQIDYPKALRHFQKQYQILERMGRKDQLGLSLANIAQIYAQTGNVTQAISFFRNATELLDDMGDYFNLAITQHKFGIVLADNNNIAEARVRLIKSLNTLENSGHRNLVVQTYLYLGKIYEQLKQNEQAQEYYSKAIELLTELQNLEQLAECYNKFGMLEYKKGNFEKSYQYFKKAEEQYIQSKNKLGLAQTYAHLGMVQKRLLKLSLAIAHFSESLRLSEELQDQRRMADCHANLAELQAQSTETALANEHLAKAKAIYQELQDQKGLAMLQITSAMIYRRLSQNIKAMECYEASLHDLEVLNEKALLATVYNEIGLIYKERGDLYKPLEYFEKAAKIQESLGDLAGLSVCYNNIGLIYDARNEFDKALEYYNKDLELSEKLGDKHNLATSYHNIAMLNFNHRNYARSLWYLEKALALCQELNEPDMITRIQERIQLVRQKL